MEINLNDTLKINPIVPTVFQAMELGSIAIGLDSMPCSLCRKVLETHPDAELVYDNHFHGSNFGSCKRKVYLTMINGRQSGMNRASFLTMGHYFEKEMLEALKAGLPDYMELKILENRSESITEIFGFKLVTHCDAYLIDNRNNKSYIVECKAIKEKYFLEMKKSKILREEWIGQGQSYLLTHQDTDGLIYLIKNRNTSELMFPFFIERDNEYTANRINSLFEIWRRIHNQAGMPEKEHTNKKDFECQFCPFKLECWKE